jgi:hypothetical protein
VGKIDRLQRDAQGGRNRVGIREVFLCRAVALFIVFLPVFHEHRAQLVAGTLQQQRGDR